jgi:hypothetical protein
MERQLLEAALVGYQKQMDQMDVAIADIRGRLGQPSDSPNRKGRPAKRKMSAAARKRISEATKKRWAEYRKNKGK